MALIQNNQFIAGGNSGGVYVIVVGIETLSFQGNQCLIAAAPPVPNVGVSLSAASANVSGNMVDLPGSTAPLMIRATDALVNGNSVRPGDLALRVNGTPTPSGNVHVIVTSNLTTGILANSSGTLIRVHNFPGP
jgi:hypothetical protein